MFDSSTIPMRMAQCNKLNTKQMITRRHISADVVESIPLRVREIADSLANNMIEKLGTEG